MNFGKRWYDENSKVSLAVGCIEQADNATRSKLAKIIIKFALQMKITAKRPSKPVFFRRWYDNDPNLSLAMEYFKNCNDKQRLELAEYIISQARPKTLEFN